MTGAAVVTLLDAAVLAAIITTEIVSSLLYLLRQITKRTFAAAWALALSAAMIRALANDRYGWAAVSAAGALLTASVWWDEHSARAQDHTKASSSS